MSVVIDLNEVCVVCFQGDGCAFKSLHTPPPPDENQLLTIAEKIERCSELQIPADSETSKIPDKICENCLEDLEAAWRFRQNCETANTVYQSIQQEEADAEALATYELERQKIKLPSGLKIKRVQPERKTLVLSVPLEDKNVQSRKRLPVPMAEEETEEDEEEEMAEPENQFDVTVIEGDVEEEDKLNEQTDVMEYEDDYYETEEMLDDETIEEHLESFENVEKSDDEDVHESKASTDALKPATHQTRSKKSVERASAANEHSLTKIKLKEEDEDIAEVNEKKLSKAQMVTIAKRPRGRPRKGATNVEVHNKKRLSQSPSSCFEVKVLKEEHDAASDKETTVKVITFAAPLKRKRKNSSHAKICEVCGNTYKYQHALNAHMRRHTNDRPYNCEFCEKAFVSGVELRRHMRTHTGQKPYACHYCDRRFSDFGSRVKHERTHTGERPYKCNVCNKSFSYAHVLSVHTRTHTGEKKFQCSLCGRGFTKKSYLLAHMAQHVNAQGDPGAAKEEGQLSVSDFIAIKTVALEECIFTTEYIEEQDTMRTGEHEEEDFKDTRLITTAIQFNEACEEEEDEAELLDEEHLEENNQLILGIR